MLILLARPTGAPSMWFLAQVPVSFWIQTIGVVVLCIVFWTSWQRGKQVPTLWLWIAVGVCNLPVSGRDWWNLQMVLYGTALRLCGALLLFKRESNAWFRMKPPQAEPVADSSRTVLGSSSKSKDTAVSGCKDVAELLLAKGAEVDAKANDGDTPLQCAAQKGHKEVAELLREHGGHESRGSVNRTSSQTPATQLTGAEQSIQPSELGVISPTGARPRCCKCNSPIDRDLTTADEANFAANL